MSDMRIIRVKGKGQIRVRPDMTRITLTLEGTCPQYGEALHRSAQETGQLKDILALHDFERSDLKTLYFNVDTEYENYKENHTYKKRFVGYKFRHVLKLEFDSDNERLGRILYALANSPMNPEIRISYTVKDKETAKNELLGKAVADAKTKAAILAQAAAVTLKDIQSIDYSWGEINFEAQPMKRAFFAEDQPRGIVPHDGIDFDIEPDDIEVSDTVTVVWEIGDV